MSFDVFISYPHQDKATADAACAVLEAARIRCWIAPRDIVPGMDWGEAIVNAIAGAKVMVLIFSGHANASPQIKREVERAVNRGIPIIPVRIEEISPSRALEYFISTSHWLDAFTPPLEKRLEELAAAVKSLVASSPIVAAKQPAPAEEPARPDERSPIGAMIVRGVTAFNEVRRAVWAVGFSIGAACVAAICALLVGLSGHVQAAIVILAGLMVALILIMVAAPLLSHRNPATRMAGRAMAWIVSAVFIVFLALAATGIGLRWPSMAASILGIEDGVTCGRPSELLKAFSCGPAEGSHVIVNIRLDDGDFGLMVRESASLQTIGKPIPPNGTGVVVTGACTEEGYESWCPVQCKSLGLKGWSKKRYLRPRAEALYAVAGVSPSEPQGLTMRSGPHQTCRPAGIVPYQSRDIIQHWCQRSPIDVTIWCRVTYDGLSGWVLDGFLERQN